MGRLLIKNAPSSRAKRSVDPGSMPERIGIGVPAWIPGLPSVARDDREGMAGGERYLP
jgi:hypothetical protein